MDAAIYRSNDIEPLSDKSFRGMFDINARVQGKGNTHRLYPGTCEPMLPVVVLLSAFLKP